MLTTSHSHSAGFDAGMGSWDNSWMAVKGLWTLAVCCNTLWVGTRSRVLSNPIAALQYWNKWARPRGPRHSGPTAPVGWAQNTISTADVFLRFGSATTSKSDLIVFDCVIIQCCRLFFFYFWGEKILSFNHTYLIAAIGATLNGPCLSSVMVMIMGLCLHWAV